MRIVFDPRQRLHAPTREFHNGGWTAYAEVPERTDAILAALSAHERPDDRGDAPILAVHDADYIAYLRTAAAEWAAAGREGDVVPYAFPTVRRRPGAFARIDARAGYHAIDAATPLTAASWEAGYWSAQSALHALDHVLAGRAAFALCRPPGHHAGADYCGGYCAVNTAAVAAQAARDRGVARVAILDIDYHHGNGTQDIFWRRGDVFYASVHADPATDYPFFWGRADETGEDAGAGTTLNLPLPRGTGLDAFRRAQGRALERIAAFGAELLIVSYGADTWEGDPISHFRLATADYAALARDIAGTGLPVLPLMEGGYALDALGANVASFLSGL